MKIIHVCPRYFPHVGGVETHVKEICERLAKNHEVEVVTADSPANCTTEVINGVTVTRFASIGPEGAYYFSPGIRKYIKSSVADIIHAHNYHAFPALFAAKGSEGKRFVFTSHYHGKGSTPFRSLLNVPYKYPAAEMFKRAEKIICVSEYEKANVLKHFPRLDWEKITVIPNGVDLEAIRAAPKVPLLKNTLLYVGRIEKYKNIQAIIRAMEHIPEAHLLVVGSGSYRKALEKLCIKQGMCRMAVIEGVSDREKYGLMKSCELMLNLSEQEAFGITVIEGLAAGKTVIVNNVGGLAELACKFQNVRPVKKPQQNEFVLAGLIKIWTGNTRSEHYLDLAEYSWDNIVKQVEQVYGGE